MFLCITTPYPHIGMVGPNQLLDGLVSTSPRNCMTERVCEFHKVDLVFIYGKK
jgi:hypothetical protein